jgi:hypothetical protein
MFGWLFDTGKDERWCCGILKGNFESRPNRGWFIFSEPPQPPVTDNPSFWICINSIAKADLERLKALSLDVPIMVMTWQAVRYCPSCGTNLLTFYGNQFEQIHDAELSREHGFIKPPER